jgi:peroxiredoxin
MLWAEPLKYERAAVQSTYVGLGLADGVICHVIDLQYTVPGTDVQGALWRFAVTDKLPRRFQKVLHTASGTTIHEFRISNLRLGNGIAHSAFEIELPEGYSYQPFVPGEKPKSVPVGNAAPDWTLSDHSGKQHRLSDYRGEIMVLNFWSSWCGYSKLGIPAIQKIHEEYNGRRIKVFGVSFQEFEGVDTVAYLRSVGGDFPNLLNGETVAETYGVKGVPAYYVIDREGKVAYAELQYNPNVPAQLEQAIERLLHGSQR